MIIITTLEKYLYEEIQSKYNITLKYGDVNDSYKDEDNLLRTVKINKVKIKPIAYIHNKVLYLYSLPLFESKNKDIVNINLIYSELENQYTLRGTDKKEQYYIAFEYLHESSVVELLDTFLKEKDFKKV